MSRAEERAIPLYSPCSFRVATVLLCVTVRLTRNLPLLCVRCDNLVPVPAIPLVGHLQMATSNHRYRSDPAIPEAKFSFDLSPTAVVIIQGGKRWYEFITSLCAIIGGVFTVISLFDGAVYSVTKRLKGAQGKLS